MASQSTTPQDYRRHAALREFSMRLEALRLAAGKPSYAKLQATAARLRTSTISTVLRGETNPTLDFVMNFVKACAGSARRAGYPVGDGLVDEQNWRNAWYQLQRRLVDIRRGNGRIANLARHRTGNRLAGAGALPPRLLPPDIPVFAGRVEELAALEGLLDISMTAAAPIAVIDGLPGVGKTSLVLHWAHRARPHFIDGDLYIDLRGHGSDPMSATEHALIHFLGALGAPVDRVRTGLPELTAHYQTLTARRRLLVVLDNAVSAEQVRPLVPTGSAAVVLVTSRISVPGLAEHEGVTRVTVGPMADDGSSQLVARVAGERARIAPDDTAEVARLCWNRICRSCCDFSASMRTRVQAPRQWP